MAHHSLVLNVSMVVEPRPDLAVGASVTVALNAVANPPIPKQKIKKQEVHGMKHKHTAYLANYQCQVLDVELGK